MKTKAHPQTVQDPLEFQVLNEIGIISQLAENLAARLLSPHLNMSQFIVLNHFVRLGGARSLVRLASAMQVTKGAMTNTVARLQAKGWLAVRADPEDGRGKLLSLTAAGRSARSRALAKLRTGLAGIEAAVSVDELASALGTLRRLRVWFDQNRRSA